MERKSCFPTPNEDIGEIPPLNDFDRRADLEGNSSGLFEEFD